MTTIGQQIYGNDYTPKSERLRIGANSLHTLDVIQLSQAMRSKNWIECNCVMLKLPKPETTGTKLMECIGNISFGSACIGAFYAGAKHQVQGDVIYFNLTIADDDFRNQPYFEAEQAKRAKKYATNNLHKVLFKT